MLNIVIPMAGAGSRFAREGYADPKPLIPVHGQPMIKVVIDNLRPTRDHRFIFICQRTHVAAYGLKEKLSAWAPGCSIIELDGLTEGAACTVLKARELIDNDQPLMIANSDQYVDCDINDYLGALDASGMDGYIMTMESDSPKWSFVGLDQAGLATSVVEKEVISNEATVGIYNFQRGQDFVAAVDAMLAADLRVNGEFYVAPAYNQMIGQRQRIGVYNIGTDGAGMHGLGIPADLNAFLALPLSQRLLGMAA
jgi:NDP-sugar pyrophosphorylase family protein